MDINKIKATLEKEGFRPTIDEDRRHIQFKYEGGYYLLDIDEDDKEFIRIVFPNFWHIENNEERLIAINSAHDATMKVKGAKIFAVGDNLWGTIELFLPNEEAFGSVLMRSLKAVEGAVKLFANSMKTGA